MCNSNKFDKVLIKSFENIEYVNADAVGKTKPVVVII